MSSQEKLENSEQTAQTSSCLISLRSYFNKTQALIHITMHANKQLKFMAQICILIKKHITADKLQQKSFEIYNRHNLHIYRKTESEK